MRNTALALMVHNMACPGCAKRREWLKRMAKKARDRIRGRTDRGTEGADRGA